MSGNMLPQTQTSVAADLAIWRCASTFTLPWADVTLEFTFISMPTSRAVTVSTVTLSMACNHKYRMKEKTNQSSWAFLNNISTLETAYFHSIIMIVMSV